MKVLPDGFNTIAGLLIALAPTLASGFGYDTSPDFTGDATEILAATVTVIAGIYALYGRITAKAPGWFAKRD